MSNPDLFFSNLIYNICIVNFFNFLFFISTLWYSIFRDRSLKRFWTRYKSTSRLYDDLSISIVNRFSYKYNSWINMWPTIFFFFFAKIRILVESLQKKIVDLAIHRKEEMLRHFLTPVTFILSYVYLSTLPLLKSRRELRQSFPTTYPLYPL